jgi:hypothetical protein
MPEPSHNSLQLGEPPDAVSDVHFFKDLNPYMRRFNTRRPKDDPWSKRRVQKYLYHNHLGSDIDPGQLVAQPGQAPISDLPLHFNNEMYLLGLSNLVPLDHLLKRLKRVTAPLSRWDA